MTAAFPSVFQTHYGQGGYSTDFSLEVSGGKSVATLANYSGARGSTTTRTGGFHATNPNQPVADIQRVGMQFTSEMLMKDGGVFWTYCLARYSYCRLLKYIPNTGNTKLDKLVSKVVEKKWKHMGVGESMQASVARTCHIETPMRGDAGLIFTRDAQNEIRLMQWSSDMLGEPLYFINPRTCSLAVVNGRLREVPGRDCVYYAGRYFRGCDPVAYKIYMRNAAGFWSDPVIYSAEDVIYVVDPLNMRSIRGVTKAAQVLKYLEKSESLLQSAVDAGIRQARQFGQVYNNSGGPDGAGYCYAEPGFTWADAAVTLFEKTPGGPFERYLFNGDKAEFQSPTAPGQSVIDGVRKADEKCAVGLGMTYGFLMAYDALGGAPSRLDVNRNTKEIERIEQDICVPVYDRIRDVTIMDAVFKGELPPEEGICNGTWAFTTLPIADAYKDSIEDIKAVRAGQDSNTRVLARYNTTPEEILGDIKRETVLKYTMLDEVNKELAAAGIIERAVISDIQQISDNPQQAQQASDLAQGKPTAITDSNKPKGQMAVARLAEHDVEGEPRDDSGKWTSGGGSGSKALVPTKQVTHESGKGTKLVHPENGAEVPAHIKALKLPPAWTDVRINPNPDADLLAQGKDAKGRLQSVYSDSHNMRTAAAKFSRIRELIQKCDEIFAQNSENLKHSDPNIQENAAVSALIHSTGIRPGSDADTGAKKKAYGATTLQGRHVTTDAQGNVILKFTGKKGVDLSIPVTDSQVADMLKQRAKKAGPDGKLFNTNDSKLRAYTHTLDGGGFKTKDFRTLKGTSEAINQIKLLPKPTDEKSYKQAVKKVATAVSQKLGNTPTIALQAYIDPTVFSGWQDYKKAE